MSRRPQYDPMDRESIRDRVFSDAHKSAEGGGATVAGAVLAVSMFLLIGLYSIRQVTEQGTAVHVISEGIRATTDVDRLLAEHGDALREAAAAAEDGELLTIPDYPLPVNIEPEEALTLDDDALRELVLARSAAIVYVTGLSPFDQTGNQSLSFLSVQGMLDQLLGALTGSTHQRAGYAAAVLLLVVTAAGAASLAMTQGFRRFRAFGLAVVLSALPGYAGAWAIGWLLRRIGGADPYWVDLRALADAMLDVGQRNYFVVGALGALIAIASVLLELADRFIPERPEKPEPQRQAPMAPQIDQSVAEDPPEA